MAEPVVKKPQQGARKVNWGFLCPLDSALIAKETFAEITNVHIRELFWMEIDGMMWYYAHFVKKIRESNIKKFFSESGRCNMHLVDGSIFPFEKKNEMVKRFLDTMRERGIDEAPDCVMHMAFGKVERKSRKALLAALRKANERIHELEAEVAKKK